MGTIYLAVVVDRRSRCIEAAFELPKVYELEQQLLPKPHDHPLLVSGVLNPAGWLNVADWSLRTIYDANSVAKAIAAADYHRTDVDAFLAFLEIVVDRASREGPRDVLLYADD